MNNKRNLRHYTVIAWTVLMLAWIIIGKFELVSAQLLPAPWNVLIALKKYYLKAMEVIHFIPFNDECLSYFIF